MPPKAAAQSARVDHMRANRQQILEQQAINRERSRQDDFDAERKKALIARQKAQYETGPRVDMSGRPAGVQQQQQQQPAYANNAAASAHDDVQIQVFVRECDGDGHMFGGLESQLLQARGAGGGAGGGGGGGRGYGAEQPPMRAAAPGGYSAGRTSAPAQQSAPLAAVARHQQQQQQQRMPPQGGGAPALGLRRPPSSESSAAGGRGQVPEYLKQRKAELQAERDEARRLADLKAEQSKYPPGHRPVSEEERTEILERLATRRKELEADLGRLPMRFDTQAIRTRKGQIENELLEVEAAERKFSVKKQLFVPV